MRILISGATGLVGTDLTTFLTSHGHQVQKLVRVQPAAGSADVFWDPNAGTLDAARLEGFDALVHLAGENIAARRWNAEQKARIRDSRIKGTKLLCTALAKLQQRPKVLVSASAIGYYGDRGAEVLTESSPPGTGFLPDVCQEWEEATSPAAQAGMRVVLARLGVVLSPKGGALAQMLLPFKLGAGGILGNGQQYFSWIGLDDVIGGLHHALANETVHGPMNLVAPRAVTNREFTKTLGKVLVRPTIFPVPAFAARLAFGEMADALLLASARVEPKQLLATGYPFKYPELEGALRHLLGK